MKDVFGKELTIFEEVREWHRSKNLTHKYNIKTQALKLLEEFGEYFESEQGLDEEWDAIGDTLVCISACIDIYSLNVENDITRLEDLIESVINSNIPFESEWRSDNLLSTVNFGQLHFVFPKFVKEFSNSVLKCKWKEVKKCLFDLVDCLHHYTKHTYSGSYFKKENNPDPNKLLEMALTDAYNVIKNRTGKIVNGNFIKDEDL